jgi:hypothetical protein
MKKLCLILACLFLFSQTAFAMPLLVGQKVVYRGTITGLRISAVDGTAFIDNLPYTYSSDFSAGVDGWGSVRGTVDGNIDDIPATDDNWFRLYASDDNSTHFLYRDSLFTVGKKYNVTLTYYIPVNTHTNSFVAVNGLDSTDPALDTFSTVGTITSKTFTFTATHGRLLLVQNSSAGRSFIGANVNTDDLIYIKDVTISEITPYLDGNHSIEIYDSSNRMVKGCLKAATSSETLGDEIATGTLVALTLYKITATEVNHFGVGLVVGSYFTSAGTETCDANNKVKQVTAGATASTIVSAKAGEVYNFAYKNASFTYDAASYYCIIRAIR